MAKVLRCGDLMPGCSAVMEGKDVAEVMAKGAEHAKKDHGLTAIPPDMIAKVQAAIRTSSGENPSPCPLPTGERVGCGAHAVRSTSTFITGPPRSASSIPSCSPSSGIFRLTSGARVTEPAAARRIASSQSCRL